MRRFVVPSLVAAAAVALLAILTFGVSHQSDTSSIDAQVADGKFPMAPNAKQALAVLGSSQRLSLANFRGKVVVLNMFASWCPPCAAEAPLLASEQHVLAKRDATLVGVTYEDDSTSSEQFARRYHINYPVLRDVSGSLASSFGIDGVPDTFVIDRQGRIRALQRFPVTGKWLSQTLPQILADSS